MMLIIKYFILVFMVFFFNHMTSLINTPEKLTDEEFESLPWILSCQKDSYQYSKEAIVKKCYELKIWNSLYSTPLESKDSNNDSSQKKGL